MSLMSLGARKTLAAAGVTALAAMAAAAPANAAQLTQTYKCTYPLIGERGLTVNIDAAIPATWETGTPTPPFAISASAEADLGTYQGLDLIGANKISGTSKATSTVTAPNFTLPVQVPIAIPEVTKPAAPPLRFEGLTGETPSLTFTQAGNVGITVDKLDLNIAAKRADGSAIVLPPVVPVDSDGDPNTFDVPCVLDPAGQNKTLQTVVVSQAGGGGDTQAPSVPGEPFINSSADVTSNSIKISWPASTDNVGVTGYEVRYEGQVKQVGNVTTTELTGLEPSKVYEIDVRAKDAAGNFSAYSPSVIIETLAGQAPVDNPPSAPTGLAGTSTSNSVTLNWTAATDDKGISGYDVYQNGAKVSSVTGTTATVSGLAANTDYKFKVQAKDTKPQTGPFSTEITVKTKEATTQPGVKYAYTLKGTSALKTLTTGPVPLSGSIAADLDLSTGNYTADLVLNSTKANLKILGLVPVKADIGFEQVDKTRGKLANGVLTATAKFNIRMKQLYLFGVLPVAGDGTCRTKSATIANMKSTDAFFDPLKGGNLKGSYGISDLTGCGLLEGIISPLAKGGGNTIDINLTPKV